MSSYLLFTIVGNGLVKSESLRKPKRAETLRNKTCFIQTNNQHKSERNSRGSAAGKISCVYHVALIELIKLLSNVCFVAIP